MKPDYAEKPEDAVQRMLRAYRALDLDEIVKRRDFDADSLIYFQSIGLPLSEAQRKKSAIAFEANFRKEMAEGISDYRNIEIEIEAVSYPEPTLAVVLLACNVPDGQKFELRIPVLKGADGWRIIRHPDYDQL